MTPTNRNRNAGNTVNNVSQALSSSQSNMPSYLSSNDRRAERERERENRERESPEQLFVHSLLTSQLQRPRLYANSDDSQVDRLKASNRAFVRKFDGTLFKKLVLETTSAVTSPSTNASSNSQSSALRVTGVTGGYAVRR
jgi:hypothetical protein